MPTTATIAQQEKYGAFTRLGQINLISSNTKIQIIDTSETTYTFDIPTSGLLSFKVEVADHTAGGGQDYKITDQEAQSGTTGKFELATSLALKLRLAHSVEPAGLALKFVGEDEQDIMREMAGYSLIQGSEFGFRKESNSVVLEVFQPSPQ
ncbi:MAG: hypothetical protein H6559_26960 [Lewinellaceae bacterium]|nr:hypothetical protein [Lewinellaceae bacterium]